MFVEWSCFGSCPVLQQPLSILDTVEGVRISSVPKNYDVLSQKESPEKFLDFNSAQLPACWTGKWEMRVQFLGLQPVWVLRQDTSCYCLTIWPQVWVPLCRSPAWTKHRVVSGRTSAVKISAKPPLPISESWLAVAIPQGGAERWAARGTISSAASSCPSVGGVSLSEVWSRLNAVTVGRLCPRVLFSWRGSELCCSSTAALAALHWLPLHSRILSKVLMVHRSHILYPPPPPSSGSERPFYFCRFLLKVNPDWDFHSSCLFCFFKYNLFHVTWSCDLY